MKGKLYAHVRDENRLILVQLDSTFPAERFDLNEWRLVDLGVEPRDDEAHEALRQDGYHEFRR